MSPFPINLARPSADPKYPYKFIILLYARRRFIGIICVRCVKFTTRNSFDDIFIDNDRQSCEFLDVDLFRQYH